MTALQGDLLKVLKLDMASYEDGPKLGWQAACL